VWGGLEWSLSPPRVIRRSAGSTSSFSGRQAVVEGNTLMDAVVDGDEYGEVIERSEGS
jgi:hypothetical protein